MSAHKKDILEVPAATVVKINPTAVSEDTALTLLKQAALPVETLTIFAKNKKLLESRKVRFSLVQHPHTPRHVLLPLLRHLFTFDLMRVALMPAIASEVKVAAEESLIQRLEKLSLGEKVSLARRASGRVAAALLHGSEERVIQTALENSRLTEALLLKEITRKNARPELIAALCQHPKWSLRHDIKVALLRNDKTPLDALINLARTLPAHAVSQILEESELSQDAKARLIDALAS